MICGPYRRRSPTSTSVTRSSVSADPPPVQYEVVHTTEYDYSESVAVSHHLARLSPRVLPHQQRLHHDLQIEPAPAVMTTHTDYFGNAVTFFAMQGAHKRLTVRARSRVALQATSLPSPSDTPPWEAVADRTALPLEALEFLFDSAPIPASADLAAYARAAFPPGRPLLDAVLELTRRIHEDFTFDPEGDDRRDAAGGRLQVAARRVSGLRTAGDRVPAVARAAGPVRQRVSRDRSAPGPLATARRRRVARLAGGLLSRGRLDSRRPHQQPAAVRAGTSPWPGARLHRCQPDPRRDPRRRQAYAARQRDARGNRPAGLAERQRLRDADQHRPPDSAPVRDRRLLGLPARARPRQPGARRHDRPAARKRRPRADAAHRRAWPAWSPSSCGRSSSPTRPRIRASSISARPAKIRTARSSACRSSTAACCRACSSCRPIEPRVFQPDDVRMLVMAGRSWRPSSARRARSDSSSRRRISGWSALAQNLWWSWDPDTTSLFPRARPGAVARARQQSGRAAAADSDRQARRARVRSSRCTAASTTPIAGCRNTCTRSTPGARGTPACCGRGPSRISPPSSACTSRCRFYSGGLGILAGDHIKSASDLGIPLVGVGLYYDQGYFRQRLDRDGWQHEDYIDVDHRVLPPIRPALSEGTPILISIETRTGHRSSRASGSCRSAATRCCCSTRTSRATSRKIAS